jgi:hypothetical protein
MAGIRREMKKAKILKESMPDFDKEEVEIFPFGDATMPRIGVMKFNKGTSNLVLDEGQPPYRKM